MAENNANRNPNPEDIIAREGRLLPRAAKRWNTVTVAGINFDTIHGLLTTALSQTLQNHTAFRQNYDGTHAVITATITRQAGYMVTQCLLELWNRLSKIAETYSRATRAAVFTRRAPTYDGFVAPRFYASIFSSIGPLRIQDGPADTTIIYAPAAATRDNFGFAAAQNINTYELSQFISALRSIGIPLASIQPRGTTGAFFSTTFVADEGDGLFSLTGVCHYSHYTRTDVAAGLLMGYTIGGNPCFEDVSIKIGFVNDATTLAAFKAAAGPSEDVAYDDEPRHVGGGYVINDFGIAPAGHPPLTTLGEGFYVYGRGDVTLHACSLARDITQMEVDEIVRYRILNGGDDLPNYNAAGPDTTLGVNFVQP